MFRNFAQRACIVKTKTIVHRNNNNVVSIYITELEFNRFQAKNTHKSAIAPNHVKREEIFHDACIGSAARVQMIFINHIYRWRRRMPQTRSADCENATGFQLLPFLLCISFGAANGMRAREKRTLCAGCARMALSRSHASNQSLINEKERKKTIHFLPSPAYGNRRGERTNERKINALFSVNNSSIFMINVWEKTQPRAHRRLIWWEWCWWWPSTDAAASGPHFDFVTNSLIGKVETHFYSSELVFDFDSEKTKMKTRKYKQWRRDWNVF